MAFEHRFEQYDIFMRKPPPLVPRELRFGVPERLDGRGNVLMPLDEAAVRALAPSAQEQPASRRSRSATCTPMLDPARTSGARATILAELMPDLSISLVQRGLAGDPRVRTLVDTRSPTPMCSR